MKHLMKMIAISLAVIAALAAVAGSANASTAHRVFGDTNGDRHGQHAYWDAAHCGLIAGDPVVVTVDGRRYLQAVGKIVCEGASIEGLRLEVTTHGHSGLDTDTPSSSTATVGMKSAAAVDGDRASLVLRLPCRNWGLNSYKAYFEVDVESNRSGQTATIFDYSRVNGRSCSV